MGEMPSKQQQKKTRENTRKNVEEKRLIHPCRCVALLLPQQKFTTDLMTKVQAPCSLLWIWRTIWRLWMANPSGPLTGQASKRPGDSFLHGLGSRLTGMGKPGLITEPSPRAEPLWRKNITSHCQLVAAFVISEDELVGWLCHPGANDETNPVHVKRIQPALRGFSVRNLVSKQFVWPH